jgi:hypothetical protein
MVPSGSVTRPQGISVSVVSCVTEQTALVHAWPVVIEMALLCGETFFCASRAMT